PKIFAETGAIFVYATTEPHEALLLGGNTATLSEGRVTQFGSTIDVFRTPADLVTARTFADPPLNTIVLRKEGGAFRLDGMGLPVPAHLSAIADGSYTIAFQPHHLSTERPTADAVAVRAKVIITEITGSESFVHLAFADARWVMLAHGIRIHEPDE
ncbi:ABC transporter ATP-binding protein, partial [Bacillus halotolerans]|uniref:ABC transporter ATP-binding protein n=1 Tax=Bacillus halotolerans TaxID=260554 RepID=UPI000D44293E